MKVIDPATILQYEKALQKDPKSQIFAALADAYRELGQLEKAETVARKGIQVHRAYVGGYVALGRILCQKRTFIEAVPVLQKAVEVAPENLLAYQLLGMCFVEMNLPKEALKAHKMALFLNPLSERSRQAVEKLEILTADEYNSDLFDANDFEFRDVARVGKLSREQKQSIDTGPALVKPIARVPKTPAPVPEAPEKSAGAVALERELSFIDALVMRNEIKKAKDQLIRLKFQGHHGPEIEERLELVSMDDDGDELSLRSPNARKKLEIDHKIEKLERLLAAVENRKFAHLSTLE